MVDLADNRQILQEEQNRFRSGVSENWAQTLSGTSNFLANRLHTLHTWHFNGRYSQLSNLIGADGIYTCLFDMEIIGFSMASGEVGSAGTTTIDIHHLTGGDTDAGSIFTLKPSVDTSSANSTYMIYDVTNAADIVKPTGYTAPTFLTTKFAPGDGLRCDIDSFMTAGEQLQVTIHYLPVNP